MQAVRRNMGWQASTTHSAPRRGATLQTLLDSMAALPENDLKVFNDLKDLNDFTCGQSRHTAVQCKQYTLCQVPKRKRAKFPNIEKIFV